MPKLPDSQLFHHWSQRLDWMSYLQVWGLAVADDLRIGSVFMLATLTAPLPLGMFVYHVYLIWAGATTSESSRWADIRDDVADGALYAARKSQIFGSQAAKNSIADPFIAWPLETDHVLMFSEGPPKIGHKLCFDSRTVIQPHNSDAIIDDRWKRVDNISAITNIYDLGFWPNVREAIYPR